jgi:serine protease inhibitor
MRFAVNHPFIFMIRHKRTGGIIFMERVTNPLIGSLQG